MELIKLKDVRQEIQHSFDLGAFRWQDGQDLMDRINALPTIDAVPVRHGEWVWDDVKCIYRCFMCKSPKAREDMDRKIIKGQTFCHVCGARMDGERREE